MTIEWLRDLVIIINGFLALVLLILIIVVILLVYRKLAPILDSLKGILHTVKEVIIDVAEVSRPVFMAASFIRAGRMAFGKVFKKKAKSAEKKGDA